MKNVLDVLTERGFVKQTVYGDDLRKKLSKKVKPNSKRANELREEFLKAVINFTKKQKERNIFLPSASYCVNIYLKQIFLYS